MASSSPAKEQQQPPTTTTSMARIASNVLQDSLQNIVHEILLQKHREHKLLLASLDPKTKLPHCDKCSLPRLLKPPLAPRIRGAAAEPPRDTQYCDLKPWSRRAGHDIYDNPFPKMDVTGRPPKPSKNNNNKKDAEGTPASNEGADANGTAPPSPTGEGDNGGNGGGGGGGGANGKDSSKVEKGEKKASKIDEKLKKGEYVPWHTCPACKRSMLITRFARHLEQCMGLSGRAASRNAMAKMNGSTPAGSRGGTPNPSQEANGDADEGEEESKGKGSGGVRKKVLKKGMKEKLKKEKSFSGEVKANGKLSKSGSASNRPPQPRSSPAPSSIAGDGKESVKRDRDEMLFGDDGDDYDTVHVKKRQKLQRAGSTASMNSQSTAPPPSAVEMERNESNDGSFVDDGSIGDD